MSRSNKTILHLIYRLDIGGLEKVMADTISQLDQFNHIIVSLTYATEPSKQLFPSHIQVIELNKKQGNDFSIWKKLFSIFKQHNIDVLHSYNLPTLEYQIAGFFARIPLRIHAEHGRDASDPNGENSKYNLLRKIVNPFIHQWVSVSQDLHQWLTQKVGINSKKNILILNGIDTHFFTPQTKKSSHRLNGFAQDSDFIIGTIGRLDPVKNQKFLLKALHKIRGLGHNSIKLAIIGSGPLDKELKTQIDELSLIDCVYIPGAQYNIKQLLNEFDLFALPSIAEGIPMTLLEAMSMSLPVLASNVGGIPEVLSEQKEQLIDPKDLDIFCDKVIKISQEGLEQNNRERIESAFSQQLMIKKYQKLYNKL